MNGKKRWAKTLLIAIAFIMIIMVAYILIKNKKEQYVSVEYANVQLYELNVGTPFFFQKELDKIIVFIKPDCPYCSQFAESIINSEFGIERLEILFISSEHPDNILQFSLNHYSESAAYLCDETT